MNWEEVSKKKLVIILFLVGFSVRLSILFFWDHNHIPPDGTKYHRIAVNLVRGNGFSNQEVEPYEKAYFREIGYPYFLAGIYYVVNIFHPVQYIKNYDINTYKIDKIYPEIVATKAIQIIMDSQSSLE